MQEVPTLQPDGPHVASALEECDRLIAAWAQFGARFRRLSFLAGLTVVWSGSMIPICIVISTQTGTFVFGRLLPALLGAVAASAAGAAQVLRPHERWRTLDRHRYLLESERLSYLHRIGDYHVADADKLLISRVVVAQQAISEDYQDRVVPGVALSLNARQSGQR